MCDKIFSEIESYCAGAQDGYTTTIRTSFTSNVINSITPSSTPFSCEFHFKKNPSDSLGFSVGECKSVKKISRMVNLKGIKERKLSVY